MGFDMQFVAQALRAKASRLWIPFSWEETTEKVSCVMRSVLPLHILSPKEALMGDNKRGSPLWRL